MPEHQHIGEEIFMLEDIYPINHILKSDIPVLL